MKNLLIKYSKQLNIEFSFKYFQNTAWLIFEKFFRMTVGVYIGILTARYLGLNDYGIFNYVLSLVGIFLPFASLGIDSIVVRELLINEEKEAEILGSAFFLKVICSVITIFTISVFINTVSNDYKLNIIILIYSVTILIQSLNIFELYFQSKVLSKFIVFSNLISLLIFSLIRYMFIYFKFTLLYFVIIATLECLLTYFLIFIFYKKNTLNKVKWIINKIQIKNLIINGWPLLLSSFLITIYMKIDQVMLKQMLDFSAVGIYSAALRLSEVWYFIPMIITSSLYPAIISAKKNNENLYYERLQKLFDLLFLIFFSLAIFVTLFSNVIVNIIFGKNFIAASPILTIHIWTGIFVSFGVASSSWYTAENFQKILFQRSIVGVVVNILLNLVLIKQYKANGAAIATLTTQVLTAFVYEYFNPKTRKIFFLKLNSMNLYRYFKILYSNNNV